MCIIHFLIRLRIVVKFHIWCYEPNTCIVIEGFGTQKLDQRGCCFPDEIKTNLKT